VEILSDSSKSWKLFFRSDTAEMTGVPHLAMHPLMRLQLLNTDACVFLKPRAEFLARVQ
jgi:hypothetical protein